ncbi:hypothetical protein ICR95_28195 (plasmid) [Priestia megaterium]|uniref:hypothetical protein n=1 Tax=Priestia megaterium TaxID=1404 RepID=UPI00196AF68A|nr:hypothetical protein [Priestia megaterium]QSF36378.1 hypothetical protein ICR95_28195 [Priestia megaterium]
MEKEQIEEIKETAVRNIKELLEEHWLPIVAFVVLIVSCQLFNWTHSGFFYPIMFVSGWIVVMFALKYKSENSIFPSKNSTQNMQQDSSYEMYTVLRVYTNDPNFQEYMQNQEYFHSQHVQVENRVIDHNQDIESQIMFIRKPEFAFCYHLLMDRKNEMYFIGEYV